VIDHCAEIFHQLAHLRALDEIVERKIDVEFAFGLARTGDDAHLADRTLFAQRFFALVEVELQQRQALFRQLADFDLVDEHEWSCAFTLGVLTGQMVPNN